MGCCAAFWLAVPRVSCRDCCLLNMLAMITCLPIISTRSKHDVSPHGTRAPVLGGSAHAAAAGMNQSLEAALTTAVMTKVCLFVCEIAVFMPRRLISRASGYVERRAGPNPIGLSCRASEASSFSGAP